jgi:hypothetical protein
MVNASPRIINAILGVWLFISAFLWPHTQSQLTNTWICGVLCVLFALVGLAVPAARYLNTILAIWLFISAWALPTTTPGTIWNNVLVAIAVFVVSLIPSAPEDRAAGGFLGGGRAPRPI